MVATSNILQCVCWRRPGEWSLPVLTKELRSRMRGLRAPAILLIATGVTITVACLVLLSSWEQFHNASNPQIISDIGKTLFATLISLVGGLCVLIAPAFTAGAISLEREQQTLELLLLTQLSSRNIVLGKFLSAMSFITILLLCALPVFAISFLLGGVAPSQLLWNVALILTTSALFSLAGLYCSALFKKTATAVALTYIVCLAWLILPFFLIVVVGNTASTSSFSTPYVLAVISLSLLLAWASVSVLSLIIYLVRKRATSFMFNILAWGAIAATLLLGCVSSTDAIAQIMNRGPEYVLLGNPGVALITISIAGAQLPMHSWAATYFVPITLGMVLLTAWIMLEYAVRQMQRLRQTQNN